MQQTQLQASQLGATGLEITRVGFGAWAIGTGRVRHSLKRDSILRATLNERGMVRHPCSLVDRGAEDEILPFAERADTADIEAGT
jgi:aryl-alcohol dehydrogenase-like predicted oxidoreductase